MAVFGKCPLKHKKIPNENEKQEIRQEIEALTQKIDKLQAHKNACGRMIKRFEEIKQEYLAELKVREEFEQKKLGKINKKNRNM